MNATQNQIMENLQSIQQAADNLYQFLNQEHQCLVARNYKELVELTTAKEQAVIKLEGLEQQRNQILAGRTMESMLADQPQGLQAWQNTLRLIGDCEHQNRVNGQLIERSQQLTRETLHLMSGVQPASETTYGPDGLKHGETSLLGKTQA